MAASYVCIANGGGNALFGGLFGQYNDVLLRVRHSNKALDFDVQAGKAIQWTVHGGANQRWHLIPVDGQYYNIVSAADPSKALDVNGNSTADGADVLLFQRHTGHNQQWQFVPKGEGYFNIVARHSGKCLDIYGGSHDDRAHTIQWTLGAGHNQQFKLEANAQQGLTGYTPQITNQINHVVVRAKHSGMALTYVGPHPQTLIQSAYTGNQNQRWHLIPINGKPGWFNIQSAVQGYLDVDLSQNDQQGGRGGNGAIVAAYKDLNGGANQQFQFVPKGDGYYQIQAGHVAKVLDVYGGEGTGEGARVSLWDNNGGKNQLWVLSG